MIRRAVFATVIQDESIIAIITGPLVAGFYYYRAILCALGGLSIDGTCSTCNVKIVEAILDLFGDSHHRTIVMVALDDEVVPETFLFFVLGADGSIVVGIGKS